MKLDATAFVGEQTLVSALKDRSTAVDCGDDRVLFRQNERPEGLYIVHDGEVSLTMRSPGGDLVMDIPARPGSLLGLPALVGGEAYSLSARAQRGAHVSFVGRDEFSRVMLQEPTIAVMILRVLAAEVRTARIAASKG
ncbi:MAG TPA: cyclic nucleotide-binding domain-containing protein [Terracidiphilus sp.]|jgi:CRP-like cAMP-binding protein|nr:cyclic nucleotide-binding domain-containing protein [Terracidiphilus sp.]